MNAPRLTGPAAADIQGILSTSESRFGPLARDRYAALLDLAISEAGQARPAERPRALMPLPRGYFVWPLSRSRPRMPGRKVGRPRHLLVCRATRDGVLVIRVLHDSMDISQRGDEESPEP